MGISYKTSAATLPEMYSGALDFQFIDANFGTQQLRGGKLRALAITSGQRSSILDMPTMAEAGFAGFEATVWYGLMVPARVPAGMTQRMNEDVNKVLAMPDVIEKLDQYGAEDGGGSTKRFAEFIKTEQAKWAKVIKEAKVSVDA